MKRAAALLFATLALAAAARAEEQSFDFKDPKGVNNIVFLTDAPLESINGTATGITGTVTFDPANPGAARGKIVVETKSLRVPNAMMNDHLMGDTWLGAKAHPEIVFELESLSDVSESDDAFEGTAKGTLTIRGESKEISAPVTLTYLEDAMGKRMPNAKGDILVVRSKFTVNRSDFGINSGNNEDKVSDEVELRLSLAGFAPR